MTDSILGDNAELRSPFRADSPYKLESLTEHPLSDPPRNVPGRPRLPLPPRPTAIDRAAWRRQGRKTTPKPPLQAAPGRGSAPSVLRRRQDEGLRPFEGRRTRRGADVAGVSLQ